VNDLLTIRPLGPGDGAHLAAMLRRETADYLQYFSPFSFEEAAVSGLLSAADRDVYMGLFWGDVLAGFFMLRGWDAGYAVPSYGVVIASRFRGLGLARLTLDLSKIICKQRGVTHIMLKVHPEHTRAKRIYEDAKFTQTGLDPTNGNLVYHLAL
jgi:GNAT superfamily N-acetyltransferase